MAKNIEAVLWDEDGTLIYNSSLIRKALKTIASKYRDISKIDFERMHGLTLSDMWKILNEDNLIPISEYEYGIEEITYYIENVYLCEVRQEILYYFYLFKADENDKDLSHNPAENSAVAWFAMDEIEDLQFAGMKDDVVLRRMIAKSKRK
jgi:phosphoglycolate phosphatase-like HAD superfamily hydrolase